MIEVVERQESSTTVFISDDELFYKTNAILFAFNQKGLTTYDEFVKSGVQYKDKSGRFIQFIEPLVHSPKSYVFNNIRFNNSKKINDITFTSYSTIRRLDLDFEYYIKTNSHQTGQNLIYPRFSKYLIPNNNHIEYRIRHNYRYDYSDTPEGIKQRGMECNRILNRMILLETEIAESLMIPAAIQNCFCRNLSNIENISLNEVAKIKPHLNALKESKIPNKVTRKKFIELCQIMKDNKIIENLKMNMISFNKSRVDFKTISCKFSGFEIFNERQFERYLYLDHPGINFIADFLDKADLLDTLEARISKEILTKI